MVGDERTGVLYHKFARTLKGGRIMKKWLTLFAVAFLAIILAACTTAKNDAEKPVDNEKDDDK
jgi:hypothetical protein